MLPHELPAGSCLGFRRNWVKCFGKWGVVVAVLNPDTHEVEAGGFLSVQGQPGLP